EGSLKRGAGENGRAALPNSRCNKPSPIGRQFGNRPLEMRPERGKGQLISRLFQIPLQHQVERLVTGFASRLSPLIGDDQDGKIPTRCHPGRAMVLGVAAVVRQKESAGTPVLL